MAIVDMYAKNFSFCWTVLCIFYDFHDETLLIINVSYKQNVFEKI